MALSFPAVATAGCLAAVVAFIASLLMAAAPTGAVSGERR